MTEQEQKEMMEAMKRDKDRSYGRKFWSPPSKKEGDFPIRFLPPLKKKNEVKFYFTHVTHWIDGSSYECLNQTLVDKNGKEHSSENCPVCQFTRKLYNTAERDTPEWKMANDLNTKTRYVYRVIVRGSDNETTPVFYESGPKIFENLFHILTETEYGNIVDPKKGRDFVITKEGTGRRSNYDKSMPSANTSALFGKVEDIKETIEKAMEMDYSSLIEFVSAETLDNTLKESLGLKTEKKDEKKAPIEEDLEEEVNVYKEEPQEEEVEVEEEDEIDNILDEFA